MFRVRRHIFVFCFLLLLPLVLLCGCSSLSTSHASLVPTIAVQQPSPTPTIAVQQPTPTPTLTAQQPTPTPIVQQPTSTPTPAVQTAFMSYIGKWQVHDEQLTINTNYTGLELWNAGPCSNTQMCNGNAHLTFTENADGRSRELFSPSAISNGMAALLPRDFSPILIHEPEIPSSSSTAEHICSTRRGLVQG